MARKKTFHTFKEAAKVGPYDERPMLPEDIDVQLHLSRNDRVQPFWLICEKDTLVALISGQGRVSFKQTSVNHFPLVPGDFVYVPAGAPHRIDVDTESVVVRYKPRDAGLEGVAWYCDNCGDEIFREVWDTGQEIPQSAYMRVSDQFNSDPSLRTCATCNDVHAPIDLSAFRWAQIAEEIAIESGA